MKHTVTNSYLATAASVALLVLGSSACQTPNYGRPLDAGAPALVRVDIASLELPISYQWEERDEILPALERSIAWTRRKHAEQFFPIAGVEHSLALASLERFHQILDESFDRDDFERAIYEEFDAFKSAGWDSKGGGVLFTGYCTPLLIGNLTRTERYNIPLYSKPPGLVKDKRGKTLGLETDRGLDRFPSRRSIDGNGLFENQGLELAWLEDPIDAYIAHVNGSAFVELPNGEQIKLGYSAKNGRPYSSLGKHLIEAGYVPAEDMNLSAIRNWAEETPDHSVSELLNRNQSYVFFQPIEGNPHGSLDVEVTAGRSLATDKSLFPRGALVFVDSEVPNVYGRSIRFQQFMFDQDTGGAIRTAGRADIYLGIGPDAEAQAGGLQSPGQLYYFFLKHLPTE
ncbi:MAG: membrane-bound lytic murein transglycosylase A [Planctomycetota bacterium]|jgi:membrane-bound lytic murein transglycosylase A